MDNERKKERQEGVEEKERGGRGGGKEEKREGKERGRKRRREERKWEGKKSLETKQEMSHHSVAKDGLAVQLTISILWNKCGPSSCW